MSFGDFMGLAAIMSTVVACFAILSNAYKRRLSFLERRLELTAGQAAEKAARYATSNADIEARLRVLERIATDNGSSLDIASQIEALRDEHRTARLTAEFVRP